MTKISINGLGYAGLTLALEFGKKFSVVGYDINLNRINELKFGYDRTLKLQKKNSVIYDVKAFLGDKSDKKL